MTYSSTKMPLGMVFQAPTNDQLILGVRITQKAPPTLHFPNAHMKVLSDFAIRETREAVSHTFSMILSVLSERTIKLMCKTCFQ